MRATSLWNQSSVILTEQVLRELILEVRTRTTSRNTQNEAGARQLEAEVEKLQADIDTCAEAALAAPVGLRDVFYGKLAEKKTALDAASARLRVVKTAPAAIDLELRRLERDALGRIKDLQKVVGRADPAAARALVRALFPDGLKATAVRGGGGAAMRLEGEAAPGLVLALDLDGKLASPAGFENAAARTDQRGSRRFPLVKGEPTTPITTPNPAKDRGPGDSRAKQGDSGTGPALPPRAALIADLAGRLAELAAAGDVDAARIASDAIARLLAAPAAASEPAAVIDLAAKRGQRAAT